MVTQVLFYRGMALLSALMTGACAMTAIDHSREPVADWPALAMRIELRNGLAGVCDISTSHFMSVVGCAVIDFDARTCQIYLDTRHASAEALMHEQLHCRGYDHPDEHTVRNGWVRHKVLRREREAASVLEAVRPSS